MTLDVCSWQRPNHPENGGFNWGNHRKTLGKCWIEATNMWNFIGKFADLLKFMIAKLLQFSPMPMVFQGDIWNQVLMGWTSPTSLAPPSRDFDCGYVLAISQAGQAVLRSGIYSKRPLGRSRQRRCANVLLEGLGYVLWMVFWLFMVSYVNLLYVFVNFPMTQFDSFFMTD